MTTVWLTILAAIAASWLLVLLVDHGLARLRQVPDGSRPVGARR